MDTKTYLLTWAKHLFKSRDVMQRKIEDLTEKDETLAIRYKDGSWLIVYGCPKLKDSKSLDLKRTSKKAIITFNTEDNFKALIDLWPFLAKCEQLSIYFINPLSKGDRRWIVSPALHARIADPESLESGLRSMFDVVDPLTPEQTKTIIKSELF